MQAQIRLSILGRDTCQSFFFTPAPFLVDVLIASSINFQDFLGNILLSPSTSLYQHLSGIIAAQNELCHFDEHFTLVSILESSIHCPKVDMYHCLVSSEKHVRMLCMYTSSFWYRHGILEDIGSIIGEFVSDQKKISF